ncbi:DUF6531 domain-containing protein [Streptomyces sp. HU2014]|uniref:putative T7SS-secreted protein n=1 Tax=Streptomyces sp. HU2014 TaxID=2939414 RepID=UPI00200E813A|nr:DUF6531 domain-containing protein [Streptomyces sp. HU2014]UQI48243.1 DUF6531 domain-containing protein [Streptomyces sp. HU2014]
MSSVWDPFKKAVDKVGDKGEHLWNAGKKKVGEGVDWATDQVGGGLEHIGFHGAADAVEDWGDRTGSALGAKIAEQQLGQTEEANELVHGSAKEIRASAGHLKDFHAAFDRVGKGMRALDASHWRGQSAETFRAKFEMHPTQWLHAADACEKAYKALDSYADTVTWAQGQAKEAVAAYKEGKAATKKASDAHKALVEAYNDAADTYNAKLAAGKDPGARPARPGEFSDPGAAKVKEAREILARARSQRDSAAGKAREAVKGALAHAPRKAAFTDRLSQDFADFRTASVIEGNHFAGGVVKGAGGVVKFVRGVNPIDPYNLTHPAAYLDHLDTTIAGLAALGNHPERTPQVLLGDGWGKDPSEATGRLSLDLASALGTGGAGAGAGAGRRALATGAREGAEGLVGSGGRRTGAEAAESGAAARRQVESDPKAGGQRNSQKCTGPTDPVNLATGRMFLPQTDVALPGALPLVFQRQAESGYRAGRWFGPSWASTADERLEIDAEGVVLVRADGMLMAYPHPAPGVPTLPSEGPRWPLTSSGAGGYAVTDPLTGRTWHFTPYGAGPALLDQVSDRGGHRITFEYDPDGTPTAVAHDAGYRVRITTEAGRITALHLEGGGPGDTDAELIRYGYTDGDLTDVVNSSGLPLRFTYDERGRITSWTDRNDSRYVYAYDDEDRCVFESGDEGHMRCSLEYGERDPATGLRVTTLTDSLGATSRYTVNDALQVVAETDPAGATVLTRQDRWNRVLSRTDALGRTTEFRYDEDGRPLSVTRPDGRTASVSYDAGGRPGTLTAPDGSVHHQTFDADGRRTSVTDPAGSVTLFGYDAYGHPASVTNAVGDVTRVRCDRAGLPVEITDPLGGVTTYRRNAFGRVTAITDPLGATTRLWWSVEGKLVRRVAADGAEETWTYDGEGNCVAHTDATGGVTRSEYTHFDRLSARTGPDGARYEFAHDTRLRLLGVTNPQGLTWSYTYDGAGRLTAETDFDGRTLAYAHDAAGQLVSRTDDLEQVIAYEHDALGRVVRKDAAGAVTTYAHDAAGRLVEAAGPDATLVFGRDRLGRVKSETCDGRTLTHAYDRLGRRTRRVTPTGSVSAWTYDAAGRRASATASGHTFTMEHDPAGREVARHFGEALTLTHAWDPAGRLTEQRLLKDDADRVQSRAYTYRPDGHLTSVDDHLAGARAFALDPVGRVTSVTGADWSERYAYDAAGNQTEAAWPASHASQESLGSRSYTGTRITRAGKVRYEHDALGRIVVRRKPRLSRKPDTWRYEWDAEDRLRSVTTPDGTRWRYRYDPLGRRIAKQRLTESGTVAEEVTFTWDGATLAEQTTTTADCPAPVTLTWDHDGLRPIAQTERISAADAPQKEIDSRFFAIVTDLVGAPSELVTEQGEIAWRSRSTLWGTTTWPTDSPAYTPLRFPGQYFDPETGLHYNFHRHYDPETGRYASPDPLGLFPAPNPVAYVHNPHTWADPLGLAPDGGCENGGSWDPEEEPHLFRGVGYADERSPDSWQKMYEDAKRGVAEPLGGHSDPALHAGGRTDSTFTSWTTDYEDMALEESFRGNGPGVVLRVPNSDGVGYSRVPGVSFPYAEGEVMIEGTVRGAEVSINGGPWTRTN